MKAEITGDPVRKSGQEVVWRSLDAEPNLPMPEPPMLKKLREMREAGQTPRLILAYVPQWAQDLSLRGRLRSRWLRLRYRKTLRYCGDIEEGA